MADQVAEDGDRERGSLAIEAAILAPAILLFLCLVIAVGQVEMVQGTVDAAARDAARAASLDRSGRTAQVVATEVAGRTLGQASGACLATDVSAVRIPATAQSGDMAYIEVTVRCKVNDLFGTWVPGMTLRGNFRSVVDHYRVNNP